jgi:hypothetical protein
MGKGLQRNKKLDNTAYVFMSMTSLIAAMAWVKDFVRLGLDVVEARLPFRIRTFARAGPNDRTPIFFVSLVNRTKDMPLFVHSVRIHYGNKFYSHFFVLLPKTMVEIAPKAKREFFLSYANAGTEIGRTTLHKEIPKFSENDCPTFDSGAALFKAIANGEKRDSWIEIDFNEFAGRRFRRGRLKREFNAIIARGRQTMKTRK